MSDSIAERQILSTGILAAGDPWPRVVWQNGVVTQGHRLREARRARGLKQIQLQAAIGCGSGTISKWEADKRAIDSEYLPRLAKTLEVTERWLLLGEGPKTGGAQNAAQVYPTGPVALEAVLFDYPWPEIPKETVLRAIDLVRAEATDPALAGAPASYWNHRLHQIVADLGYDRTRLAPTPRGLRGR